MVPTVFLLLMLVGSFGAAAAVSSPSDLQVYGETIHGEKSLLRDEDTVRKQLREQTKSKIRRILDSESFNVYVNPTAGKISLPTIIKLLPTTTKPLHKYPNMPLRFGRQSDGGGSNRSPTSTSNLPQRFGRSWGVVPKCAEYPNALLPPHTSVRNVLFWSLLRILANAHLLHRSDDFDLTASEEQEEDLQGKTSAGMKRAEILD